MIDTTVAGQVAGVVSLVAYIPYIISILRGKTIPNRATWLIWSAVGLMIVLSYHSSGATDTIWVPVIYFIGPLIISILAIKKGEGGWTLLDRWCLSGAGVSIALWWILGSPLVALTINIIIDFIGVLPTVKKTYLDPYSEDLSAWSLFFIGNIINMFAIKNYIFAISIYPTYMLIATGLMVALILIRRKKIN